MSSQKEKYSVGMAGEHFVVAELLRRGVSASITMGNAKRVDVVALNNDATKVVVAEVKSSPKKEWIVGNIIPQATLQPWVLVHIPADGTPPRYFILTANELNAILSPGYLEYKERFLERHGKPFTGKGVFKLKLAQVSQYENNWSSIINQIF
ncbi:MAG: hypothetical protein IT392_09470 [Nitrospirae bacterium]|nr:hypothetical protein [Nitrospirota bacterium]